MEDAPPVPFELPPAPPLDWGFVGEIRVEDGLPRAKRAHARTLTQRVLHLLDGFGHVIRHADEVQRPPARHQHQSRARQQFEIRTHKSLIDIMQATAKTIEALNKLSLPAGVDIKIKATSRQ